MNLKYFFNGFFAVFGLFSVSDLMVKHSQHNKNNIASYWEKVGQNFKIVFDEQTQKIR